MPFNGNGTFNTIGDPAVVDELIRADQFNNAIDDIATGLTTCMTRDGQSPPTANIPMGGMRLTGMANGVADQDAATKSQVVAMFATAITAQAPNPNLFDNSSAWMWQRSARSTTPFPSAYGFFGADRWAHWCSSVGTFNSGSGGGSASGYFGLNRTIGSTNTSRAYMGQMLPNRVAASLAGRTITVGFNSAPYSGNTSNALRIHMFTGTGTTTIDSCEGLASLVAGTWTGYAEVTEDIVLASGYPHKSVSFNVPAGTEELAIAFSYAGTSTAAPAGGDGFIINQPKLEVGSLATAYEMEAFAVTEAACSRYYEKSFSRETVPAQNAGVAGATYFNQIVGASTALGAFSIQYKAKKRIGGTPVITLYNPSAANAQIRNITGSTDWSASTAANASENGFTLSGTSPAGSTAASSAAIHWSADYEMY